MIFEFFESLHIIGIYFSIVLLIRLSFEIGYRIGKYVKLKGDKEASNALSPMVGGLLGMLAFVLAFTFSMAAGNHDLRKHYVLDEANAIGTAYLRADLLDSSSQNAIRNLLREYVDIRIKNVSGEHMKEAQKRSLEIHTLLWTQASAAAIAHPGTNSSLVVQSINEVIDMHEKRITAGIRNRIPVTVWIALFIISTLSMLTMGVQAGLSNVRRLVAVFPLLLSFGALATVVVDLDRPQNGTIVVGQEAMISLQKSMYIAEIK